MSHSLRTGPDRQRSAAPAFGTGDPTFAVFAGTLGTPSVDDRSTAFPVPTPGPDLGGGPDLVRLRRELVAGTVRGIVVDHPGGRECMGEMGCVGRLSDLLDTLAGVEHGEFVTPARLIRFVRTADGAVAVDVVPGTAFAATLDAVLPVTGPSATETGR